MKKEKEIEEALENERGNERQRWTICSFQLYLLTLSTPRQINRIYSLFTLIYTSLHFSYLNQNRYVRNCRRRKTKKKLYARRKYLKKMDKSSSQGADHLFNCNLSHSKVRFFQLNFLQGSSSPFFSLHWRKEEKR